jgi:peptidoglycan/LPS O-acetylase OafA/YrhL
MVTVTHLKYRADIDGLRGMAVMLVVMFHYFPEACAGGFIGVDIFFVISGFLISTIVLDDLAQGSFSFLGFYSRRIRRIFPALLLLLLASLLFAWFALLADDYKQIGKHVAAAALFVSNYILWNETGYFDVAADSKFMLHLWSLGIEEQFYLAWPLLLWLSRKRSLRPMTLVLAIGGFSFALNVHGIFSNELATFYSPLSRLWELLVGSAVACHQLARKSSGLPIRHSNIRSWLGASLIAISVLALSKDSYFPGWWALLPTVGAGLAISSGTGAWINRVAMSNRVLVWFGLISFPLYLWHWPVLSFLRVLEDKPLGTAPRISALAVSLILAWLTYVSVEKPLRFGNHGNVKSIVLLILMVITGAAGFSIYYLDGLPNRNSIQALQRARGGLEWPRENISTTACSDRNAPRHYYCAMAEHGVPTIALIGDSHANHFYPGFVEEYSRMGERLIHLGDPGCPPILDVTSRFGNGNDQCAHNSSEVLHYISSQTDIHTVILAANWHLYMLGTRFKDDATMNSPLILGTGSLSLTRGNIDVFDQQMKVTIALLKQAKKRIVVIKQIPELDCMRSLRIGKNPFRISDKAAECRGDAREVDKYLAEYERHFDSLFAEIGGVTVVDLKLFFCDRQYCYSTNLNGSLYRDDLHLSVLGSRAVAEDMFGKYPDAQWHQPPRH